MPSHVETDREPPLAADPPAEASGATTPPKHHRPVVDVPALTAREMLRSPELVG